MASSQVNVSYGLPAYLSDPLAGTDSAGRTQTPLVGSAGQEYVQASEPCDRFGRCVTLSTNDPQSAIGDIQARGALQDPRCRPLLGLLDQLGMCRAESHRYVLEGGKKELLARIAAMQPDKLLTLLELSFPFVGISDLRAIPLAVLDRLQPVPATFLKQLSTDRELFGELPLGVQRQVWELDKKLLQSHALPLVWGYTYETATVIRALDMDLGGPPAAQQQQQQGGQAGAPKAGAGRALPQLPRRVLRSGSASLQRLAAMVGKSRQIYKSMVELCCARYRDSDSPYLGMREAALCTLRGQLLMALHDQVIYAVVAPCAVHVVGSGTGADAAGDAGVEAVCVGETELCQKEPCHKLAWTLDACLKDRSLDERRVREVANFFQPYEGSEARARQGRRSGGVVRARSRGHIEEDAESAGAPGASHAEEPNRELGDAGMVLRDPSTLHLMLHQVIRRVEAVVDAEEVPGNDRELIFLTRLLQLAVGSRGMMRDNAYVFPEGDPELLGTFYPLLAALVLEAALREGEEEEGEPDMSDANLAALVPLLTRHEVVRKVTQAFCLERMGAGDLLTARALLQAMVEANSRMSDKAIPEFAPFGYTLARRMAALLAEGRVEVGGKLWLVAVDQILVKLVDAETQVHEEVLRLLLAAAQHIPLLDLVNYLHSTLANSRKSRKRWKKRRLGGGDPDMPYGGYGSGGEGGGGGGGYHSGSGGGGYFSAGGFPGQGGEGTKSADGVRATYLLFTKKVPGLNETVAPSLFSYLETA
ncbi:hypothetical protein N2152v2_001577 [Parachlorella kessleri]